MFSPAEGGFCRAMMQNQAQVPYPPLLAVHVISLRAKGTHKLTPLADLVDFQRHRVREQLLPCVCRRHP